MVNFVSEALSLPLLLALSTRGLAVRVSLDILSFFFACSSLLYRSSEFPFGSDFSDEFEQQWGSPSNKQENQATTMDKDTELQLMQEIISHGQDRPFARASKAWEKIASIMSTSVGHGQFTGRSCHDHAMRLVLAFKKLDRENRGKYVDS